jgi:hypothetical protein
MKNMKFSKEENTKNCQEHIINIEYKNGRLDFSIKQLSEQDKMTICGEQKKICVELGIYNSI